MFSCDIETATAALAVLQTSPGMMVRQPLSRSGNALAFCDYHQAAAPYLHQVHVPEGVWGRGAAGKPTTKLAFMMALELYIEQEQAAAEQEARWRPLRELTSAAMDAFRSDFGYATAMASAASAVLRRRSLAVA